MASIEAKEELNDQPQAKKQKLDVEEDVKVEKESEEASNGAAAKETKLEADEDVKMKKESDEGSNGAAASDVTKLEQDIIDQVEYYFGDANMFRDKFLQAETTKNEGWIPLSTLITFKRLASLSTDIKVIADALFKSDSGLLEISDDHEKVRRNPERPLPEKNEETRQEIISRTAYVKGFPKELEMPDLLEFFKTHPKVSHIVIRKYLDKPSKTYKSKGSVFVTFSTRDQCSAFLSQDVKYKEGELITKWQSDYYAGKKTERAEKQKEKNAKLEPEIELPKGAVLIITEIKPDVTREIIKAQIESMEFNVAFVDFTKGDEKAYVRLSKENGANELLAKLENGKIKLEENEAPVSVLGGEDEEKYLADCVEKIKLRRQGSNNKKRFNNRKRQNQD